MRGIVIATEPHLLVRWDDGSATRHHHHGPLAEAVRVPYDPREHPRVPGGHEGGGRFVAVHGNLPPALRRHAEAITRATLAGEPRDEVDRLHREAQKRASRLHGLERGDAERTLRRVYAAALNPSGGRGTMGSGTPLALPEAYGITDGWDARGWRWRLTAKAFGRHHDEDLAALGRSDAFEVSDHDGEAEIRISPRVPKERARAIARNLEITRPQLRRMRSDADGYVEDDTPIDLGPAEYPTEARADVTRYPGIDYRVLGDAAELQIADAMMRLGELGVRMRSDQTELPTGGEGNLPPLDWVLGDTFGVEVKSFSMREFHPEDSARGGMNDDPASRAAKIAECQAKEVRPVLVRAGLDLDNDTVHLFWHEYDDPKTAFTDRRVPKQMLEELAAGQLRPGDTAIPVGYLDERRRWAFLGSFRLRQNPLRPGQQELRTREQRRTLAAMEPQPLDVGVGKRILPEPSAEPHKSIRELEAERSTERRVENSARDARIVDLGRSRELSHAEIAKRVGVSSSHVGNVLRANKITGRLKNPATVRDEIKRLHSEDVSIPQIAKRVGVMRGFVERLVGDTKEAQVAERDVEDVG